MRNTLKHLIGFVQFRFFIPNLGQKFLPFCQVIRKENAFTMTDDHHLSFNFLKSVLIHTTDLTFRFAEQGLQYVNLYDASFHGTGFLLMLGMIN